LQSLEFLEVPCSQLKKKKNEDKEGEERRGYFESGLSRSIYNGI